MSSAAQSHVPCQHYREGTALGASLMDTLDGLIQDNRIAPAIAFKVLAHFDVVVADVLANDVHTTFKAKAHIHKYNWLDDVFSTTVSGTLTLNNGPMLATKEIELKKMRIIAMRAQDAHSTSQRPG